MQKKHSPSSSDPSTQRSSCVRRLINGFIADNNRGKAISPKGRTSTTRAAGREKRPTDLGIDDTYAGRENDGRGRKFRLRVGRNRHDYVNCNNNNVIGGGRRSNSRVLCSRLRAPLSRGRYAVYTETRHAHTRT